MVQLCLDYRLKTGMGQNFQFHSICKFGSITSQKIAIEDHKSAPNFDPQPGLGRVAPHAIAGFMCHLRHGSVLVAWRDFISQAAPLCLTRMVLEKRWHSICMWSSLLILHLRSIHFQQLSLDSLSLDESAEAVSPGSTIHKGVELMVCRPWAVCGDFFWLT